VIRANDKGTKIKKITAILSGLGLVMCICFLALKFIYTLQDDSLQNTWKSEETGQVLTFMEDGKVEFESDLSNGIYHILSPNAMEYTIDGKTFKMNYYIEDNKLYWGIDKEHMECFSKKWL